MLRPVVIEGQRAAALRFAVPRVLALFSALVMFDTRPAGFRGADLRARLIPLLGLGPDDLPRGRVSYDLRRLRLRGLIERRPHSHRYQVTTLGAVLPQGPHAHSASGARPAHVERHVSG